jgi:hypothetical protein
LYPTLGYIKGVRNKYKGEKKMLRNYAAQLPYRCWDDDFDSDRSVPYLIVSKNVGAWAIAQEIPYKRYTGDDWTPVLVVTRDEPTHGFRQAVSIKHPNPKQSWYHEHHSELGGKKLIVHREGCSSSSCGTEYFAPAVELDEWETTADYEDLRTTSMPWG